MALSHLHHLQANHIISHLIRFTSIQPCPSCLSSYFATSPVQVTDMASAAACFTPVAATGAVATVGSKSQKKTNKSVCIQGLNPYRGLKSHNSIFHLGQNVSHAQSFAKVVCSLAGASRKGRGGGALGAKCANVSEIFQIAAIMNGLVLVGVAVGFVLLRIEAAVEESE